MSAVRPHSRFRARSAVAVLLLAGPALGEVRLDVQGLGDRDVEAQLRSYVGLPGAATPEDLRAYLRTLPEQAQRALQAVGYYSARTSQRAEDTDAGDTVVYLEVDLGEPVRVTEMEVTVRGEALQDPAFAGLLENPGLAPGDVLDHGKYERLKTGLLELALQRGYFDARFDVHQVLVERGAASAAIELRLDSGIRYAFGETEFAGGPIDPELLQRWLPYEPGTPYSASLVAELTNSLLDTGYFNTANVVVQRERASERRVPILVELESRDPNAIGLGVGYATDTGPRTRATWTKPYVNRRGHSLQIEAAVSQVRQSLNSRYRIPSADAPATRYYQLEAAMVAEKFQDTESFTTTAAVQRVRVVRGWQETLQLRWLEEDFKLDTDRRRTRLYLPGIAWSRTKRRGDIRPRWGTRYSLRTEAASRDFGSDVDLQKVVATGKWLQPILERHRLVVRAELGAMDTNDFDRIPSSERFFAGGDQSIRGFAYRSVSPQDADGTLIGGRFLSVGSAEFVYQFSQAWGVAAFVDGGRVYNDDSEPLRIGAGFGLRWESPVGTLRVDLGFGVSETDVPVRLHLTIGPDL